MIDLYRERGPNGWHLHSFLFAVFCLDAGKYD